jgi:hypothetical protein
MKTLSLVLLFAQICLCHGDEEDLEPPYEPSTRNDFIQFTNSLPEKLLSIPLQHQEVLFHFIDLYNEEKKKIFPYELFYQRESRAQHYGSLTATLDVAVVFIGFPANSLPRMKELWFDQLTRTDHLEGLASSSHEEVLRAPGRVHLKHHFHVIETSLHLETALISAIDAIAQPKFPHSDEYYLNAWEVDALLTSLKQTIFDGGHSQQPAMTFFLLNLALLGEHSYSYRNGFSREDMNQIKQSEAVRHAAGQVVRLFPHKSRVILDEAATEFSLSSDDAIVATAMSPNGREEMKKFETDQIRSSKAWATSFVMETLGKVTHPLLLQLNLVSLGSFVKCNTRRQSPLDLIQRGEEPSVRELPTHPRSRHPLQRDPDLL